MKHLRSYSLDLDKVAENLNATGMVARTARFYLVAFDFAFLYGREDEPSALSSTYLLTSGTSCSVMLDMF